MLTYFCVVNDDTAEVVYSGSYGECSQYCRKAMTLNPGKTYVLAKVVPVATFTGPTLKASLQFPARHQLLM